MTTKIWAHRGASAAAPENTMTAFELAVKQGADGIELDVHLSADHELVVTHDENCRRVTGTDGMVGAMTLQQLRQLNFAQFRAGFDSQSIPTLADVFDLIRPTGMMINVELKNSLFFYPGLEEKVLDLTAAYGMQDQVCLSSFNHASMVKASRLIADRTLGIGCGLLYSAGLFEPWDYARRIGVSALHPHLANLLIPNLVQDCHAAGIAIHAWTIDQPDHLRQTLLLGIDAIITNVPDQALVLRHQMNLD